MTIFDMENIKKGQKMKYSFVIKEKAIGKERPRKGKNGFYTPRRQRILRIK